MTAAWIVATVDGSTYHDTAEEAERVAAELVSRVRAERLASGSRLPVREPLVYRIEVDGWHDLMRPGDDCGGTPDWCLAPNGVECAQHDENGDRRG